MACVQPGRHPAVRPPARTLRRALRLAGWNALLLIAGLTLIGLAGEAWLRATAPIHPTAFVPGVGVLLPPDTEIRWPNRHDYRTVSRTNRLGFLDREPPSPERAAQSCHIAMIGDSFVEAREVPIADKFHVRLEEMAARELPTLNVTTSAFGKSGTGQINQLAFYDEYVRPLRPKLVVLVFVSNDYVDNFPLWKSLSNGLDPEHMPHVSAARAEDGSFRLRPPDPEYRRSRLPRLSRARWRTFAGRVLRTSRFLSWLRDTSTDVPRPAAERMRRVELLSRRPAYAPLLDGWRTLPMEDVPGDHALFAQEDGSPFYTEALAFTAFALDQFKERTERDGAALAVLASDTTSLHGGGMLARLNETAAARGIPVIDQGDFIRRQGAELRDARWPYNVHWNPAGHQWAAEALLEYLKRNRDVCG